MAEMTEITKGSAKQIAWAEDIRARWIADLDAFFAPYLKKADGHQVLIERLNGTYEIIVADMTASDDAKHYIDLDVHGYYPDWFDLMNNAAKKYLGL